jgi:hypothetical protein
MIPTDSGGFAMEVKRPIRLAGSPLGSRAHICVFFNTLDDEYEALLPFNSRGLGTGTKGCSHGRSSSAERAPRTSRIGRK